MATIINNPPQGNSSGPLTLIVVVVVLLILGYLGVVYGLPALKNVNLGGAPTINVPSSIDVNVKQSE